MVGKRGPRQLLWAQHLLGLVVVDDGDAGIARKQPHKQIELLFLDRVGLRWPTNVWWVVEWKLEMDGIWTWIRMEKRNGREWKKEWKWEIHGQMKGAG